MPARAWLHQQRLDTWQVFDNSGLVLPSLIASRDRHARMDVVDDAKWNHLVRLGNA